MIPVPCRAEDAREIKNVRPDARPLAALTLAVVAAALVGLLPRWPGLVQQVALPPLDLFADTRVLAARAPSPQVFAVGFAAAFAIRTMVLAAVLGASRRRLWIATRLYSVAAIPSLLAATLDFSAAAALYAWFFWAGLLVVLVTFVTVGALPWRGVTRQPIRGLTPEGLRAPTLLCYLVCLAALGAAARAGGQVAAAALVPVSAAGTLVSARLLCGPPRRPPGRAVAAGLGVSLIVLVAGVVADEPPGVRRPPSRTGSLFLVPGVDGGSGRAALFRFDPATLGFTCAQTFYFSYVGLGGGAPPGNSACPIRRGAPYAARDTLLPLGELAATFVTQVGELPAPVVVVTHSQGAWIAWAALTRSALPGVRALLMLGPFPAGRAGYPPPGRDGEGAMGGDSLRLLVGLGRVLGVTAFNPDAPLPRQLQSSPSAVRELFSRRLPADVAALAVLAQHDLPIVPSGQLDAPDVAQACPAPTTHAGLVTSRWARVALVRFLASERLPGCTPWARWPGPLTEPFGVPPDDP